MGFWLLVSFFRGFRFSLILFCWSTYVHILIFTVLGYPPGPAFWFPVDSSCRIISLFWVLHSVWFLVEEAQLNLLPQVDIFTFLSDVLFLICYFSRLEDCFLLIPVFRPLLLLLLLVPSCFYLISFRSCSLFWLHSLLSFWADISYYVFQAFLLLCIPVFSSPLMCPSLVDCTAGQ